MTKKDILIAIIIFMFFSWMVVCVVMACLMLINYISCSDVLYSILSFITLLFTMIAALGLGYILFLILKEIFK